MEKRVTVYDHKDYYWIFTTDGINSAVDMADTAKEAASCVQKRLLSPLMPMQELMEETENG